MMRKFKILLVISARKGSSYTSSDININNEKSLDFSLSSIRNGNYHFIYTFNTDEKEEKYEGNNYANKALFNDLENSYLLYGNTYFKDYNGVWSKTEVSELFKFTHYTNIKKILDSAMLEKKTEYSSNEVVYNYNITTSTLDKIINDMDTDIADNLNTIILTTNSDKEVYKIEFDLTPYSIYKYGNTIKISLEYSEFGNIEEIKDIE